MPAVNRLQLLIFAPITGEHAYTYKLNGRHIKSTWIDLPTVVAMLIDEILGLCGCQVEAEGVAPQHSTAFWEPQNRRSRNDRHLLQHVGTIERTNPRTDCCWSHLKAA
jgi:hypothetical protein